MNAPKMWLALLNAVPSGLRAIVQLLADRPLDPSTKFAGSQHAATFVHNGYRVHVAVACQAAIAGAPNGLGISPLAIVEAEVRRRNAPLSPFAVEFVRDLALAELIETGPRGRRSCAARFAAWDRALVLLTGWTAGETRERAAQMERDLEKESTPFTPAEGGAA